MGEGSGSGAATLTMHLRSDMPVLPHNCAPRLSSSRQMRNELLIANDAADERFWNNLIDEHILGGIHNPYAEVGRETVHDCISLFVFCLKSFLNNPFHSCLLLPGAFPCLLRRAGPPGCFEILHTAGRGTEAGHPHQDPPAR